MFACLHGSISDSVTLASPLILKANRIGSFGKLFFRLCRAIVRIFLFGSGSAGAVLAVAGMMVSFQEWSSRGTSSDALHALFGCVRLHVGLMGLVHGVGLVLANAVAEEGRG